MQNIRTKKPRDFAIERFRRHNLKVTPQRPAVYELIRTSKEHPTAEQVYLDLKENHPSLSYDTVNRALNLFAKIGLIDRIGGFGTARRYDPDTETHHHLFCLNCGRIMDFKNETYDELKIPAELNKRFKVLRQRVVLSGVCAGCGGH